MAHFTELDENNIVIRTIVLNDAYILDSDGNESDSVGAAWCRNFFGQVDSAVWLRTSYNGNIRKQYAEPGFKYDAVADEFSYKLTYIYPPRSDGKSLQDGFSNLAFEKQNMESKLKEKVKRDNNIVIEIQGSVIITSK